MEVENRKKEAALQISEADSVVAEYPSLNLSPNSLFLHQLQQFMNKVRIHLEEMTQGRLVELIPPTRMEQTLLQQEATEINNSKTQSSTTSRIRCFLLMIEVSLPSHLSTLTYIDQEDEVFHQMQNQ